MFHCIHCEKTGKSDGLWDLLGNQADECMLVHCLTFSAGSVALVKYVSPKSVLFSYTTDCKELYLSLAQFPSVYPNDPKIPHSFSP